MSDLPPEDLLATAQDDDGGELEPALDLQPKVGRYLLLDRLGAGAMGTVFLAHDPELERKVAIKLLRGGASEQAQVRMQREAQAMAQLTHTNVVAIYDVGRFGKEVFLAMEHLSGGTLAQWLAADTRSWSEVLSRFLAAGRGLEAAHALGLVHRDFKPANVLLSAEGVAKVTDFGLVRSSRDPDQEPDSGPESEPEPDSASEPEPDSESELSLTRSHALFDTFGSSAGLSGSSSVLDMELTLVGSSVGTPAYMAPEQFSSERTVDARSDQFSFCVALHEALWGHSPFAGGDVETRKRNVLANERLPQANERVVPQWLVPIIDRGLAPEREDRWPSMSELLAALGNDPALRVRRRQRRLLGLGLALALVAGFFTQRRLADQRCASAAATTTRQWSAIAPSLSAAMEASDSSYARANIERLHTSASDWVQRWSEARSEACQTHTNPDALTRQRCLNEQAEAFAGLLEVLEDTAGEPGTAAHAIQAIAALPPPSACSEANYASAHAQSCSPAVSRAMHHLRALESTGRYREGLAAAELLREDPALAACPRLEDELRIRSGRLALEMGSAPHEQVAVQLRRALHQASAREDLDTARAAALALFELERDADALPAAQTWLEVVELLDESRDASPEAIVEVRLARAELARKRGEREQARELLRELEALLLDTLGSAHPSYLRYLVAAAKLERGAPAQALLERALDMAAQLYGPDHPRALDISLALLVHEPDLERRLERNREVGAKLEAAYGPSHEASLLAADRIGIALIMLRRYDEAASFYAELLARHATRTPHAPLAHARASTHYGVSLRRSHDLAAAESALLRAVELFETQLGPDSSELSPALSNLANVVEQRGRIHEAIALLRRAERAGGEDAVLLDNRGMLELQIGYHAEALRDIRRAAELLRASRAQDDLAYIDALTDLARAELANDMLPEARARFEGLLERCDTHPDPDNAECAFSRGIVAQFLLEHPASEQPGARAAELQRALALAARAREHLDPERFPVDSVTMAFIHARVLARSGEQAEARAAVEALLPRVSGPGLERRGLQTRAKIEAWLDG